MSMTRRTVAAAFALVAVLGACTDDGQTIDGTSVELGDGPLSDDEVTLHMAEPPELSGPLSGAEVTRSELRTEDQTSRETVQLVDVPASASSLDEVPPAGAVLRVPAGQTLRVGVDVDAAGLEPDATDGEPGVLRDVRTPCAAPCEVDGPALVAPAGWMAGFGVAEGWQLLVPSPIG